MAKRKKSEPWDAAFRRVKALHWPQLNYPPRTTPEELDQAEKALGFLFPLSYRAFAQEFGLSGTLGCSLPRLLPLFQPEGAGKTDWYRSVVAATEFYHTFDWSEYIRSDLNDRLPFFRRVILFAMDSGYHDWVFDPTQVTHSGWRECRIYDVNRSHEVTQVAISFPEWVNWIREHYVFDDEDEVPDQPPEFAPVYKPDSPHPDAMLYDRDTAPRHSKERPGASNVKRWLAFNNNAVRDLARSIRDGRPEAFPVLADALEEAGCTNADLLDSCRTGDPDIDGVWVLRVLLGKE